MPSVYGPERNSTSVLRTGRRNSTSGRLDRAAMLVEEADDRGQRRRHGEQQADLHGEAQPAATFLRGFDSASRCLAASVSSSSERSIPSAITPTSSIES